MKEVSKMTADTLVVLAVLMVLITIIFIYRDHRQHKMTLRVIDIYSECSSYDYKQLSEAHIELAKAEGIVDPRYIHSAEEWLHIRKIRLDKENK